MADIQPLPGFSLSGGGWWGSLVGKRPLRVRVLLAISITWVPLALLSALEGTLYAHAAVPFLHDPAPQVRFLIAMPLLLLADQVVDGAVAMLAGYGRGAQLVPAAEQPALQAALERAGRRRDARWVEGLILLLALGIAMLIWTQWSEFRGAEEGDLWLAGREGLTAAGWWYCLVCVPLFQFLVYRWVWRYLVWAGFLRDLSRLKLRVEATHPDLAGGLGLLESGQMALGVVALALGAFFSGILAHEILFEGSSLMDQRLTVAAFVVVAAAVVIAPLLFFIGPLVRAKRRALVQYGVLGAQLSGAFRERWIQEAVPEEAVAVEAVPDE